MKNLKVNFIALVALVIGIVTMSFKLTDPLNDFHYTGPPGGPYNIASNWEKGSRSDCDEEGSEACQIEAPAENETELSTYLSTLSSEDVFNMASKRD